MKKYSFKDVKGALSPMPIVRLLVREKSGLWYVDQGFMLRTEADARKQGWNRMGYGCLILKHAWIPNSIKLYQGDNQWFSSGERFTGIGSASVAFR